MEDTVVSGVQSVILCGTETCGLTWRFKTKYMQSAELKLQAQCTQWFWNTFPDERRMLHNNDNNSSSREEGNRKKALGVVAGVADLELICPNGRVLFIELKIPGGKQSAEQIDFQRKVEMRRHIYIIVYSFEEFKELIWQVIGK